MARILLIAGARPNFMKVAPLLPALHEAGHESLLVHTGQHYDAQMSTAFFEDLNIPKPDFFLGAGSSSHAQQTARVMAAFEPVLLETRPAWVVVVGDVNSTLACALVAAKLKEETGCRIAHVEAGLRSGDWRMPEEVNRVLTDRLADLLLTPSREARLHLLAEGLDSARICFVGNVMIDTLLRQLPRAKAMDVPGRLGLQEQGYALVTLHRPSNVDDPVALRVLLQALRNVAATMPVMFPMHPRTRKHIETFGLRDLLDELRVIEPLGYREMLSLTASAAVVLTDSGGLQEETTVLGIPCVTLREQTERPVTITEGTNRLAPWPLTQAGIAQAVGEALAAGQAGEGGRCPDGWDGLAAERIAEALTTFSVKPA